MSIQNKINGVGKNIYENIKNKDSGKEVADKLAAGMTTAITTTASNGFTKQIAVIQLLDLLHPLKDEYEFLNKGTLEFGIGTQYLAMGWKSSKSSNSQTNGWLPTGDIDGLPRYTMTSTGVIERQVRNDYSSIELKEYTRSSENFNGLIAKELNAGYETKMREHRELSRSLFGIKNTTLPADYEAEILPIKKLINQNVITVPQVIDRKGVVNELKEFMDIYYRNISNNYNAGNKPNNATGNIWIDGTDTGAKLLMNTARKEDTVLVMSTKFKNRLAQELGNTFNPAYWSDFTSNFGQVIYDTFDDELTFYILDKTALGRKSMFDEYNAEYYYTNSAVNTLTKWRENWFVIPAKNIFSMKFTLPPKLAKADSGK